MANQKPTSEDFFKIEAFFNQLKEKKAGNWFTYEGDECFEHYGTFCNVTKGIDYENPRLKNVLYLGGYSDYFTQFCQDGKTVGYTSGVSGLELIDSKGRVIGQIPYIPIFSLRRGGLSCSTYNVDQLSETQNRNLDLEYSWNGGKDYSWKWNDNANPDILWVTRFLPDKPKD